MMHVETAALGPNDSYVLIDTEGKAYWSGTVPKELRKLLQRNKRRDITILSFTETDFVLGYADGTWYADADDQIIRGLHKVGPLNLFAFGPQGSYIMGGKNDIKWSQIPKSAAYTIQKEKGILNHVALGQDQSYYLQFDSVKSYWSPDLNPHLQKILKSRKHAEAKVYLSPDNDSYFAIEEDFSYTWSSTQDLTTMLESNGETMSPEEICYSVDEIPASFDDGRPIIDTVDELQSKAITEFDIPAITVVPYNGQWFTLDNRRLWAFIEAEVAQIPVIIKRTRHLPYELKRQLRKVDGFEVEVLDPPKKHRNKHKHRKRSKSKSKSRRSKKRTTVSSKKKKSSSRDRRRSRRRRSRKDDSSSDSSSDSDSSSSDSSSDSSSSDSSSDSSSSDSDSDSSLSSTSSDSSDWSSSSSVSV